MTDETGRFAPQLALFTRPTFSLAASLVILSGPRKSFARGCRDPGTEALFRVLVALFQAQGRVFSARTSFIARCWEGWIVGEDVINRAIEPPVPASPEMDGEVAFCLETIPRALGTDWYQKRQKSGEP